MHATLVVFDLDGTLVDSLPDIASALNAALARHALAPLPLDVVRTMVGEGVRVLAERALARHGALHLDPSDIAADIGARYLETPCVASRLYDGVEDALAALREQPAVRLAVLTNKLGAVARALLSELRVAERFDAIVGDGDGHPRKPAPDALRALAERFGVPLERTVMVGDGLPDMAVAAAAPCASAAALWGYTPAEALRAHWPTYELAAPRDIVPAVLTLRGS